MTRRRLSTETTRRRPQRRSALGAQLDTLEGSRLIFRAQVQPEIEYLFRHALVQEAAYGSLLKQQRRALHDAIATALEALYPERLDALAPVLAHHFDEAEDHARAVVYYMRAGDLAARKYALPEAIMHYRRGLQLVKGLESANAQPLQHLYVSLGRLLEMSGQYAAALEHYVDMESFARERVDLPLELAALLVRGTVRSAPTAIFDAVEARALAERGLLLAQALHDRNAEAHIMANRALLSKFDGDWRQMVVLGERAATLARELDLRDLLAHVLNDTYSAGLMAQGDAPRARQALAEANAIWRELDNQAMLADNLGTSATFESTFGNYDAALVYAEEAYRISCAIGNLWNQSYAQWTIGEVSLFRGEMDTAIRALQDAINLGERAGFAVARVYVRAILALAYACLGDCTRSLNVAHEAVTYAMEEMPGWLTMPLCMLALVQTWAGELAEADETVERARPLVSEQDPQSQVFLMLTECELAIARGACAELLPVADRLAATVGVKSIGSFLGWALSLKGEILRQLGRLDKAREVLDSARVVEEAHQGRNVLWLILARLSAVEAARGDGARALALRQEASTVLEFILAHTSDPELRASFIARPDVRALLHA